MAGAKANIALIHALQPASTAAFGAFRNRRSLFQ
jgi:hypothetical protein